jgi:FlaG/FlaF family flagellin (archaellin)
MFNLFNQSETKKPQLTHEEHKQGVNEYIRQSQLGYNVNIAIGTTSAILTFGSIILFYSGKIEQTHLNIGTGVISSVVGFKSANDTNNKLKEFLESCKIVNHSK